MALPARLSLITIGTRDHARMRAFYIELGWPVGVDIEGDLTSFLLGGVVLALWPLELLTAEAAPGSAPPGIGWSGVTLSCNFDGARTSTPSGRRGSPPGRNRRRTGRPGMGRPVGLLRRPRRQPLGGRLGAGDGVRRARSVTRFGGE